MNLTPINRISDICLLVPDVDRSIAFYQDKLGFELKRRDIGFAEFKTEGITLALWELGNISESLDLPASPRDGFHLMVAVQVERPEIVEDQYAKLKSKGVLFTSEPKLYPWNAYAAYFFDPDDNLWEIYTWVKDPRVILKDL